MSIFKITDKSTVIIHDEYTGDTIAKTKIRSYDSIHNSIMVDERYFSSADNQKVYLVILNEDNIIECMGNVRKQGVRGMREISLYQTKVKEDDRGAVRYSITLPAVIENMIEDGIKVPLAPALDVEIKNISTSGVLLIAWGDDLAVNSSFQLKLNIEESEVLINTSVVRIVSEEEHSRKLGCCFISLSE